MSTITVKDGTAIDYKDWGRTNAQPTLFQSWLAATDRRRLRHPDKHVVESLSSAGIS